MQTPKLPPHPLGWSCSQCRAWRDGGQEVYVLPNGQNMPANQKYPPGMIPIGTPKIRVGLCQNFPQWQATPPDNYCWGGFKPRQTDATSPALDKALDEFEADKPPSIMK